MFVSMHFVIQYCNFKRCENKQGMTGMCNGEQAVHCIFQSERFFTLGKIKAVKSLYFQEGAVLSTLFSKDKEMKKLLAEIRRSRLFSGIRCLCWCRRAGGQVLCGCCDLQEQSSCLVKQHQGPPLVPVLLASLVNSPWIACLLILFQFFQKLRVS